MTTIGDLFGWVWAIGILPTAIAFLAVALVHNRRDTLPLRGFEMVVPAMGAIVAAVAWPIVAVAGGIYVVARRIADRIPDPVSPAEQKARIREQEARIRELERELGIGGTL